jgi:FAD:protein FMN transferase
MHMTTGDRSLTRPTRREFVAFGAGAFVVAALPAAALARRHVVRRTVPVMGTVAELAVVHRDEALAQRALTDAVEQLRWVERTMSRFDPLSDIGRANAAAAQRAVTVSAATADVVAEALRWAALTDGAFDPAIGSLVALWDVSRRTEPPAAAQVERLAGRRLHRTVELAGATVIRHDADARLDLGGIAKGHGVDRAVAALRAHGITDAIVNVGGDLYAMGRGADGDGWRVGIRSPDDARRVVETLRVSDAAIATSGSYEQGFRHRGVRYHHLMDPLTGGPRPSALQSVTVRAATCMTADAAATAAFGLQGPEAARLLAAAARDIELVRVL